MGRHSHWFLNTLLFVLFAALVAGGGAIALGYSPLPLQPPSETAPATEYLATSEPVKNQPFSFRQVPLWLYGHVAVIAALQVLAVLAASLKASRRRLDATQRQTIAFLCEIPMYLGLFGTLLGVCLTQFISGSLVAPLAYITTMSGIVLHVLGKLFIWIPLATDEERDV